jgi:hypothetical protein
MFFVNNLSVYKVAQLILGHPRERSPRKDLLIYFKFIYIKCLTIYQIIVNFNYRIRNYPNLKNNCRNYPIERMIFIYDI